jgi:hypothetical protein
MYMYIHIYARWCVGKMSLGYHCYFFCHGSLGNNRMGYYSSPRPSLGILRVDAITQLETCSTLSEHKALFMAMGWVYVSELRPLTVLLFIPQMIYEIGELRRNDVDKGKPKNPEKNLSHCQFFHHKSHTDWLVREPRPPRWEAGD